VAREAVVTAEEWEQMRRMMEEGEADGTLFSAETPEAADQVDGAPEDEQETPAGDEDDEYEYEEVEEDVVDDGEEEPSADSSQRLKS